MGPARFHCATLLYMQKYSVQQLFINIALVKQRFGVASARIPHRNKEGFYNNRITEKQKQCKNIFQILLKICCLVLHQLGHHT